MAIKLTSPAFADGGMIPPKFTCDGRSVSPALQWGPAPAGTKSWAVICNDPDAPGGNFVHWILYDLPAGETGVPEALPLDEVLDNGAKQGTTDYGSPGYSGPCPPSGVHRYVFRVFALDTVLSLPSEATEDRVLKAIKGHVLDEGKLTGKYGR